MRFKALTEDQIQSINLLPPGKYDFEVMDAQDKTSKSGNEMIELKIKVWDANGYERHIFDYLLEALPHKLRHFSKAANIMDKYDAGILDAKDCTGKSGKLEIMIQKDKTGQYPDKNAVKDYLFEAENFSHNFTDDKEFSDPIPF